MLDSPSYQHAYSLVHTAWIGSRDGSDHIPLLYCSWTWTIYKKLNNHVNQNKIDWHVSLSNGTAFVLVTSIGGLLLDIIGADGHLLVTSTKLHQTGTWGGSWTIPSEHLFSQFQKSISLMVGVKVNSTTTCLLSATKRKVPTLSDLPVLIFSRDSYPPRLKLQRLQDCNLSETNSSLLETIWLKDNPFLVEGHVFACYGCYSSFVGCTWFILCMSWYFPFPIWGSKPPWCSGEFPKALWPAQGYLSLRTDDHMVTHDDIQTQNARNISENSWHENNPTISQLYVRSGPVMSLYFICM